MESNPDAVPSTIRQAAEMLVECMSPAEHYMARKIGHEKQTGLAIGIQNAWFLSENDTPLKRDAALNHGIAHPDDVADLIMAWAWALIREEPFFAVTYCKHYHDYWKSIGADALTAGGWPPPEESQD